MNQQDLSLRTEWKVESFTEKGKFYNVERFGDEFVCDCPSFENRHLECKHIKKVKEMIDIEGKSNGAPTAETDTKKPKKSRPYLDKGEEKFEAKTVSGYPLDEVVSALQKAIRRGQMEMAIFWMYELYQGGFCKYLFRRLMTIAIEDCGAANPGVAILVNSCYQMAKSTVEMSPNINWKNVTEFYPLMAVWHLVKSQKSREVDNVGEVVLAKRKNGWLPKVPDEALDQHTKRGRQMGKKDRDFYTDGWLVENERVIDDNKYKIMVLEMNGLEEEDQNTI